VVSVRLPTIGLDSMLPEIVIDLLSFLLLIILKEFTPAIDYTLKAALDDTISRTISSVIECIQSVVRDFSYDKSYNIV